MRRALLFILGVPLLSLIGLAAFPLSYGTGDPPNIGDSIWMFGAFIVDFAKVTVFSLLWWVVTGAMVFALHLQRRAQATGPIIDGLHDPNPGGDQRDQGSAQ